MYSLAGIRIVLYMSMRGCEVNVVMFVDGDYVFL